MMIEKTDVQTGRMAKLTTIKGILMKKVAKLLFITVASGAATTAIAQQEAVENYNQLYATQILSQHENIMPLLDKDGDGMCSASEFMSAHRSIFDALDTNKDGLLSETEIKEFQENQKNS